MFLQKAPCLEIAVFILENKPSQACLDTYNDNAPITGKESGFPVEQHNWVRTDYKRLYFWLLISSLQLYFH